MNKRTRECDWNKGLTSARGRMLVALAAVLVLQGCMTARAPLRQTPLVESASSRAEADIPDIRLVMKTTTDLSIEATYKRSVSGPELREYYKGILYQAVKNEIRAKAAIVDDPGAAALFLELVNVDLDYNGWYWHAGVSFTIRARDEAGSFPVIATCSGRSKKPNRGYGSATTALGEAFQKAAATPDWEAVLALAKVAERQALPDSAEMEMPEGYEIVRSEAMTGAARAMPLLLPGQLSFSHFSTTLSPAVFVADSGSEDDIMRQQGRLSEDGAIRLYPIMFNLSGGRRIRGNRFLALSWDWGIFDSGLEDPNGTSGANGLDFFSYFGVGERHLPRKSGLGYEYTFGTILYGIFPYNPLFGLGSTQSIDWSLVPDKKEWSVSIFLKNQLAWTGEVDSGKLYHYIYDYLTFGLRLDYLH